MLRSYRTRRQATRTRGWFRCPTGCVHIGGRFRRSRDPHLLLTQRVGDHLDERGVPPVELEPTGTVSPGDAACSDPATAPRPGRSGGSTAAAKRSADPAWAWTTCTLPSTTTAGSPTPRCCPTSASAPVPSSCTAPASGSGHHGLTVRRDLTVSGKSAESATTGQRSAAPCRSSDGSPNRAAHGSTARPNASIAPCRAAGPHAPVGPATTTGPPPWRFPHLRQHWPRPRLAQREHPDQPARRLTTCLGRYS